MSRTSPVMGCSRSSERRRRARTTPSGQSWPHGAGQRVEYAAFGDTVNLAARLQSAAAPGEVLVDDATRRALEPLFEWGAHQELVLKGKDAPVSAWPVRGIQAGAKRLRGLPGVE